MIRKHLVRSLVSLLLAIFCTSAVWAQNTSISGTITDPQNNAIPNATITLTNKANNTSRTITSGSDGAYNLTQVPPGLYRIKVEATGFASIVDDEVQVLVNTPLTLSLQFKQLGSVSDTVTVTGGEAIINTTDATIGNTFDNRKVTELPLLSRNVVGLLSLQPGVTAKIDNENGTDDVKKGGYVNGARSDQSNVTLDGVDVNEQQGGAAFFSALRSTPDSLQEFRVTTTNANSDAGRSSGAQISLVTRSGTNSWHGALYEYNRNEAFAANDWFSNKSGVERAVLRRNNFGGAVGGPIKRDRAFFFFNYERFMEDKGAPVVREVPLASLGQGIVRYYTADGKSNEFGSCPAGTPTGVNCLNRAQISAGYLAANGVDPGTNSAVVALLADAANRYKANDTTVGDGLNTGGYRFNAPLPTRQNTLIGRLDYILNSKHNLSVRANYQNDTAAAAGRFNDTPSPTTWSQPKGIAIGEAWTISNSVVNNFRYGLTRTAFTQGGDSDRNDIYFRFIFAPVNASRANSRVMPIHNVVDDLSWTKGSHAVQGGINFRFIANQRTSFSKSYDTALVNPTYYNASGAVLLYGDDGEGDPIFSNIGGASDDLRDALATVIGRLTQYSANLNYDRQGNVIAPGTGIKRDFRTQEYDVYLQDSWKIKPNLTVNYGLRWSNSVPVYEANGLQVKPVQSLGTYFEQRLAAANAGKTYNDPITIDLAGKANGKTGFYKHDWNNFGPSISAAWSPSGKSGLSKFLFGENKSTLRGGYRLVYDRLGGALAVSFDGQAILGFGSSSQISANTFNVTDRLAPAFTGVNQSVRGLPLLTIPATLKFPLQQPSDQNQRIESGLDDSITSPYNHTFNFSYGRDLGKGYSFEASYVGRLGRNLLVSRDIMHFNNIRDPKSGVDFYTAMRELISYREKNSSIAAVPKIAYFENILPGLAGNYSVLGTNTALTASQAAYRRIARSNVGGRNTTDYTFVQVLWNDGLGYSDNLFYHPQYAAFGALSSIGSSDYHGMQMTFKKRFSDNFSADFNYTWSHSFDIASGLEPSGSTISGSSLILNPLDLKANRGPSDFDVRHIINANYNYVLPFGKGQSFLSGMNPVANFFFGGWQTTGIFRWNTGIAAGQPYDDGRWATNWNVQSNLVAIRNVVSTPTRTGDPNLFSNPVAAYSSYRNPYPGEVGDRNTLREPGYVVFDAGFYKTFNLPWEGKRFIFRTEIFNLTNTQRFTDVNGSGFGFPVDPYLDTNGTNMPSDFGKFQNIQGSPRQMQFALRFEF